jgi:hypothetical protein
MIGRLEHIAEHFEKRADISQWSQSVMIKGLLKQPTAEFNILEAWRTLVDADDDQFVEWSSKDAADLKMKLEFRRGTPVDLAQEAFARARMRANEDRMEVIDGPMWTDHDRMET